MTLVNDVQRMEQEIQVLQGIAEANKKKLVEFEEQINGKRGVQTTLDTMLSEIQSLRRAAYWVAGVIVAGSIAFAFAALKLVGA